jgi:hypothetical protein
MAKKKLMTFVEFEAFIAQNEWISNDDFDHECNPDNAWFRVDTAAITKELDGVSSKILAALGPVPVSPGHLAWSRGLSTSQSAHYFMYINLRHRPLGHQNTYQNYI